jgi:hypothetical protein
VQQRIYAGNIVASFYHRVPYISEIMNFCLEVPLYYNTEMETDITSKNIFVMKEVVFKRVDCRPCHNSGG